VSTAKQGEHGVSLQEQRDAILRYAQRNDLEIATWFEERVTAAKRGRPIFNQMLKLLRQGKASGLIIHKIDRGARNMKDWAELGELIDQGIEVQCANESLDMHSRGGRLSADIQAVVAADYIRNLREETRKGFYGRIKQGVYPLPAPLGYLDKGKGNLKELDPAKAPLVKRAFELYATGSYSLDTLGDEMCLLGLRNRKDNKITRNGLSVLLNNPFYIGLIRLRRTNETFPGSHQPLIAKSLFDRAERILQGKTNARSQHHDFLFRRLLTCTQCEYSLIGERQKGHIYYRCHTKACSKSCVREETVEEEVLQRFSLLRLNERERAYAIQKIGGLKEDWSKQREGLTQALRLRLGQLNERLARLTDAYIDRVIEKDIFEDRKTALLMERKDTDEKLIQLNRESQTVPDQVAKFLELAGGAYSLYKSGFPDEKRDLLKTITSNRHVEGKNVEFMLALPFNELANRSENTNGSPYRDTPRTLDRVLSKLIIYFKQNPASHLELSQPSEKSTRRDQPRENGKFVARDKDGKVSIEACDDDTLPIAA
jgi:site-specific DNA recombinase